VLRLIQLYRHAEIMNRTIQEVERTLLSMGAMSEAETLPGLTINEGTDDAASEALKEAYEGAAHGPMETTPESVVDLLNNPILTIRTVRKQIELEMIKPVADVWIKYLEAAPVADTKDSKFSSSKKYKHTMTDVMHRVYGATEKVLKDPKSLKDLDFQDEFIAGPISYEVEGSQVMLKGLLDMIALIEDLDQATTLAQDTSTKFSPRKRQV